MSSELYRQTGRRRTTTRKGQEEEVKKVKLKRNPKPKIDRIGVSESRNVADG